MIPVTVREKIANCLNQASKNQFNAYISVPGQRALKLAESQADFPPLPLAGISMAVKDNIAVKDVRLTCGSKMLEKFVSPYSSTVVSRLEKAGAITVAKTNMDEFGMGSSSEYSAFGRVMHAHTARLSPGGSSGGSAVAVASGDVDVALGSDTGGSVRQPAAFCGVSGLRPTYGSFSRYGLVAFCSSLDQIGILSRDIDVIHRTFDIGKGIDDKDMTSMNFDCDSVKFGSDCRVAFLENIRNHTKTPEILNAIQKTQTSFQQEFCLAKPVELPDLQKCLAAYYVLSSAEVSSNLSRFDGIRYSQPTGENPQGGYFNFIREHRTASFGSEVKRRILIGNAVLSSGYRKDLYGQANCFRTRIRRFAETLFKSLDLLVLPTTPTLPFEAEKHRDAPVDMYHADIFTVFASLAGCPALSIPVPETATPVPASIQLISGFGKEHVLFDAARYLGEKWK